MSRYTWIIASAAAAALIGGCDTPRDSGVTRTTPITGPTAQSGVGQDSEFLREAAIINQAEIESGRLASQNATDPEVRRFGQMLSSEHGESMQKLEQLAHAQDVSLPNQLDEKHRVMVSRLSQLQGAQFDREFLKEMIKGHEEAISKFENQMRQGRDPQAKSFAANTLPTLREHLRIARELDSRIASGRSATGMDDQLEEHREQMPNTPPNR